jgi:hypothetical protein
MRLGARPSGILKIIISLLEGVLVTFGLLITSASGENLTDKAAFEVYLPWVRNNNIDIFIDQVKIIQGTSASGAYQLVVANRDTLVRVFVGSKDGLEVSGVTGRLCGYDLEGKSLGCQNADNGSIKAPSIEQKLNRTLNFSLPAGWINPGHSFHVKIDPNEVIEDGYRPNNRYPQQGLQPFNAIETPPLEVMVIPIEYIPYPGGQSYLPKRSNLDYLTSHPIKLLPVPEIDYQVGDLRTYQPDSAKDNLDSVGGWANLLSMIGAIHAMEDPAGAYNYYGLVNSYAAHGCDNGCITGISYLGRTGPYQSAAGWSGLGEGTEEASLTLSHELGHNFNRNHVLCTGNENNIDEEYPYPGGSIGVFGLDVLENRLYPPGQYSDFMSYCSPIWTSDYTFWNIHQFRQSMVTQSLPAGSSQDALYVSGWLAENGELRLRNVYRQTAPIQPLQGGRFRLELLDEDRRVVAAYPFEMVEVADIPMTYQFGFFVPYVSTISGVRVRLGDRVLGEKFVAGELTGGERAKQELSLRSIQGRTRLEWPPLDHPVESITYRLRVSRDGGETWQVLTLDWLVPAYLLPEGFLAAPGKLLLEVQASDGIHTRTDIYEIDSGS